MYTRGLRFVWLLLALQGCDASEGSSVALQVQAQASFPLRGGELSPSDGPLSDTQKSAFGIVADAPFGPFSTSGRKFCSAVWVSPRIVLSAAHCFPTAFSPDDVSHETLQSHIENGAEWSARVVVQDGQSGLSWPVQRILRHPTLDLAALVMGRAPANLSPMPLPALDVPPAVGDILWTGAAGAGTTDEQRVSFGRFRIEEVSSTHLVVAPDEDVGFCVGDSGAPLWRVRADGTRELLAIHRAGYFSCAGGQSVRLDAPDAQLFVTNLMSITLPEPSAACESAQCRASPDGHEDHVGCYEGLERIARCSLAEGLRCDEEAGGCIPIPCGETTPTGHCEEDIARVCVGGALIENDCGARGLTCGYDPTIGRVGCRIHILQVGRLAMDFDPTDAASNVDGGDEEVGDDAGNAVEGPRPEPDFGCTAIELNPGPASGFLAAFVWALWHRQARRRAQTRRKKAMGRPSAT